MIITFSFRIDQSMFTIWRPGKKKHLFAEHLLVAASVSRLVARGFVEVKI